MANLLTKIGHKVGDTVRVYFAFPVAGVLQTGLNPTITLFDESNNTSSLTETESPTDIYFVEFTPDAAGWWKVKIEESTIPYEDWRVFEVAAATLGDKASDIETDTQDLQSRLPASLSSGRMRAQVEALDANAITASSIATDAITAAKIAPDAIGASELAADAVAEIQSGLATTANVSAVETDTQDIQSRLPASLVGGRMRAHVEAFDADVITAAVIATDAIGSAELATTAVNEIRDAITAVLNDLTPQEVRDAMKLAPTVGAPSAGSVDEHLDDILADTAVMQPTIATNLNATISSRAVPGDAMSLIANAITAAVIATNAVDADALATDVVTEINSAVLSAIAALNNLSQAGVQSALTAQGLTTTRAANLDNLDAAVSTRATPAQVDAEIANDTRLILLEKILRNRTQLNPATGAFTVYDDDSTTPLITGTAYLDVSAATPYDGTAAVHRRNRLS